MALVGARTPCDVPVSVRMGAATRTVKKYLSVLDCFFLAAMAGILQLKDVIIVADGLFTFP